MQSEKAPRLRYGRRLGMAGGFLLLSGAGAVTTGMELGEAVHDAMAQVHAAEATAADYRHQQQQDDWIALAGAVVFLGAAGGAGYAACGTWNRIMRSDGQWAWETPAPMLVSPPDQLPDAAALPAPIQLHQAA